MRTLLFSLAAILIFGLPLAAFAQETAGAGGALAAPKKDLPDKPTPSSQNEHKILVSVEHSGTDNVGSRLAYHLKELFDRSSLFTLSTKDERKLKLILRTVEEFPGRPNMSSAYSAIFVYSETEGTLKYLLSNEVGFVHSASVKEDAEALAGKTHEVYSKYSYLFE